MSSPVVPNGQIETLSGRAGYRSVSFTSPTLVPVTPLPLLYSEDLHKANSPDTKHILNELPNSDLDSYQSIQITPSIEVEPNVQVDSASKSKWLHYFRPRSRSTKSEGAQSESKLSKNSFFVYENLDAVEDAAVDEVNESPSVEIRKLNLLESRLTELHQDHCHDRSMEEMHQKSSKRATFKLVAGLTLCAIFMVIELVGGYFSHSLAIFTDAAHLTSDMFSFAISLLAIQLAQRRPTSSKSFGYYRLEVIGVLFSVFSIWFLCGLLVYLAIHRMITQEFELDSVTMLAVSGAGLALNLLMWLILSDRFETIFKRLFLGKQIETHGHDHHGHHAHLGGEEHNHSHLSSGHHGHSHMNMNVRAAILHIIGDIIQSIGVLVASLIVHFWPHLKLADPICTLLFGCLVIGTTQSILKDAFHILMEGVPPEVDYEAVRKMLKESIPGVCHVHSLHIWSLTHGQNALSVHLTVESNAEKSDDVCFEVIRTRAEKIIRHDLRISHTTIQVETHLDTMNSCVSCQGPKAKKS